MSLLLLLGWIATSSLNLTILRSIDSPLPFDCSAKWKVPTAIQRVFYLLVYPDLIPALDTSLRIRGSGTYFFHQNPERERPDWLPHYVKLLQMAVGISNQPSCKRSSYWATRLVQLAPRRLSCLSCMWVVPWVWEHWSRLDITYISLFTFFCFVSCFVSSFSFTIVLSISISYCYNSFWFLRIRTSRVFIASKSLVVETGGCVFVARHAGQCELYAFISVHCLHAVRFVQEASVRT